ncbi:hypothetical protein PC121_g5005 [Phytophthora cactorum]|nr:hypothetical protein PC120_g4350 [Phytophthora cactorum]KAG3086133.1 hypothetical protein PC121_g5005 [Phytophthora cactorum]KAG4050597.1 hypothetical protein PC123_g14164 [Phytophthora cactorum]
MVYDISTFGILESQNNYNVAELALKALEHEQKRRKQQRRRMVLWRIERMQILSAIRDERQRLEKELEQLLRTARMTPDELSPESKAMALYRVTIEQAALRRENIQLREAIEHHVGQEDKIMHQTYKFLVELREAPQMTSTTKQLAQDGDGWWVNFPNGEPPFFFHPLSKTEYMHKLKHHEAEFAERHPCTATIGNLLGWTVDYAPPSRQASGTVMAHARFSRQIRCSLDDAFKTLLRVDTNQWPSLISPRSWGRVQRGDFYCQPLQRFGGNNCVVVCNIPGDIHFRYIALAQHAHSVLPDGRRVLKHCIVIVDSEENARNREAEGPQKDVQWAFDGGEFSSFTEMDENTIHVEYEPWAECLSEAHGRELYIDWIRFAVRLEEYISPVRLLQG